MNRSIYVIIALVLGFVAGYYFNSAPSPQPENVETPTVSVIKEQEICKKRGGHLSLETFFGDIVQITCITTETLYPPPKL